MTFRASPMVVAVALGLLNRVALIEEDEAVEESDVAPQPPAPAPVVIDLPTE